MRIGVAILFNLLAMASLAIADETLPLLKAGGQTYTHVTIFKVSVTDIYFTCDQGMANAKLKDLTPELQKHFHFNSASAAAIEQKQKTDNAQYHVALLNEVVSRPPEEKREAAPAPATSSSDEVQTTLTKIGNVSPVPSIHTIDGQNVDFHGKVVVLDFFATWCGPCMEEMPYLDKYLWQPLKGRGLILIAVGRDHSESEVRAFQQQKGFAFPFAADPAHGIYGQFASKYIPRCVLIGRDGRIKYQTAGFSSESFNALISATSAELQN